MKPRDPRTDPQPGDRVEHIDGGTMYVVRRTDKMVYAELPWRLNPIRKWMRLSTFTKVAR